MASSRQSPRPHGAADEVVLTDEDEHWAGQPLEVGSEVDRRFRTPGALDREVRSRLTPEALDVRLRDRLAGLGEIERPARLERLVVVAVRRPVQVVDL